MIGNDLEHLERQWDGGNRKGRPKAAARQRAGEIVAQTAALQNALICWDGPASVQGPAAGPCRPLAHAVAERLASRPPGLYLAAVRTPFAADLAIVAVDGPFLASVSYQLLVRSRRYPRALPLAGGTEAWRQTSERRLAWLRAAQEARRTLAGCDPAALHLEGASIWLGPGARRPSQRLATEAIQRWLASDRVGPAQVAGAIVLGQRQSAGNLPPALRAWWQVGRALPAWPPDLIAALPPAELGRIGHAARACARLKSPETCAAILDFRLAAPNIPVADLLAALPLLHASLQQYDQEPQRRWGKFVQHLTRAFEYAAAGGLSFAFADALRATGADRGRSFGSGEGLLETVNTAARWFLGRDLPAGLTADLTQRIEQVGQQFRCAGLRRRLDRCRSNLPAHLQDAIWRAVGASLMEALVAWRAGPAVAGPWNVAVGALAGRLAATGAPHQRLAQLAGWLEHCRTTRTPVDDGEALRLAGEFLAAGVAKAETPADQERFLEVLANHGPALLATAGGPAEPKETWPVPAAPEFGVFWKTLSERLPALTRLGILDAAQLGHVMSRGMLDDVDGFLPEHRAALPGFIDWLRTHAQADRPLWSEVFLLATPALTPLLSRWVERLVAQRWSWADAEYLLRIVFWKYLHLSAEQTARHAFLAQNFWIVERIVAAVGSAGADAGSKFFQRAGLIDIAYQWRRHGHADLQGLLSTVLAFCDRVPKEGLLDSSDVNLAVALATGQPRRLLAVLQYGAAAGSADDLQPGWQFLTPFPGVRTFLSSCADQPHLLPRVFGWLHRLSVLARLPVHDFLHTRLRVWERPAEREQPPLDRLRAYHRLAGHASPYPDAVARVLDRPRKLAQERAALEQRQRTGVISASALVRLEKLHRLESRPEQLAQWVERDLAGILARQVPAAGLAALEATTRAALRQHWEANLGAAPDDLESPDWDNALRLYHTTPSNRRTLKALLRHLARGDRSWIAARPPNRAFVDDIRRCGVQVEPWLGPTARQYAVGAARWTVRIETDPLKVLWMGRLFGTCLSPGDCNAFAAVANAVEVNKRVLYLTDGAGRIIGRKLLVLGRTGVVFGFRSYGSGECDEASGSPWVKLLFDLFTLELAQQMGARLATAADETAAQADTEKQFRLFARWYFDGFEPFDGWLLELDGDPALAATRQAAADRLRLQLEQSGTHFARDHGQTLRALLWLGPAATAIVAAAAAAGALTAEQSALLTPRSDSPGVSGVQASHAYG